MHNTIAVAMSGGVDSSVAVWLLRQEGWETAGVTLRLFQPEDLAPGRGEACHALQDAEDARAVAAQLGIPHYTLDLSDRFAQCVMDPFAAEYEAGRTPNPCVVCNRTIKFGALLEEADKLGYPLLATGHYAQVERDESSGRFLLKKALHPEKDQSYVLWSLTQAQLARVRLPLGLLSKEEIRSIAQEQGLISARKRDSQDICFVPDGKYADFIERTTGAPAPAGDFLDGEGRVLGRHRGIIRYTLGQHKGLGLSTEEPLYVLEKDAAANTIRLGPDSALWSTTLTAADVNWVAVPEPSSPLPVTVKTRYSQREAAAEVEALPGGRCRVTFAEPQRAVTPGQAVVFYRGEAVVGGGTICGR